MYVTFYAEDKEGMTDYILNGFELDNPQIKVDRNAIKHLIKWGNKKPAILFGAEIDLRHYICCKLQFMKVKKGMHFSGLDWGY